MNAGGAGDSATEAELAEEIARTREELADTVEGLTAKADVKAAARRKAGKAKERAVAGVSETKERVASTAEQVKDRVTATAGQAADVATVKARRHPGWLAVIGGALAALLLARRGIKRRKSK